MHVVISGADDHHIEYVERHLDQPFVLLDTRDILIGKACTYNILGGGVTKITQGGRQLKDVQSVWYRRAMRIQPFELPVADDYKLYAENAIRFFNRLLFAQFKDAFWLSDYFAIEKANDKLWQLQVASGLGFNVPDTLFTASAAEATTFVRNHKLAIAKPNYSSRFQKDGKAYGFYTSYVDDATDFSGLCVAPAILQAAIKVKTELRITVVGNKVFAASVRSNKETAKHLRDWRVASLTDEASFAAYTLPTNIEKRCIALVKELGLQFGAIDAIIDPRGKFWFLENNPNGQWAFIEQETGLPIGKAVAELLEHGKAKR